MLDGAGTSRLVVRQGRLHARVQDAPLGALRRCRGHCDGPRDRSPRVGRGRRSSGRRRPSDRRRARGRSVRRQPPRGLVPAAPPGAVPGGNLARRHRRVGRARPGRDDPRRRVRGAGGRPLDTRRGRAGDDRRGHRARAGPDRHRVCVPVLRSFERRRARNRAARVPARSGVAPVGRLAPAEEDQRPAGRDLPPAGPRGARPARRRGTERGAAGIEAALRRRRLRRGDSDRGRSQGHAGPRDRARETARNLAGRSPPDRRSDVLGERGLAARGPRRRGRTGASRCRCERRAGRSIDEHHLGFGYQELDRFRSWRGTQARGTEARARARSRGRRSTTSRPRFASSGGSRAEASGSVISNASACSSRRGRSSDASRRPTHRRFLPRTSRRRRLP